MITAETNTYLFRDGMTFIVSSVPGQCACGRMSFLFKNRDGRTFCLACEGMRTSILGAFAGGTAPLPAVEVKQ
jgi:hypothetical protein